MYKERIWGQTVPSRKIRVLFQAQTAEGTAVSVVNVEAAV